MDPVEVIAALERSYEHAAEVVAGVGPDQLAQPSRCEGWDVRATLNHLVGATVGFTAVNEGGSMGGGADDFIGDDPQSALAHAAAANVASWRRPGAFEGDRVYPFGTFPAEAAALMNLEEVTVHTWDVAAALGKDTTVDPATAEMVCAFLATLPLDMYRQHGVFGPEVTVAPTAPASDRMLGLVGRQPT